MSPTALDEERRAAVHNHSREASRQWEGTEEGCKHGAGVWI